MDNGWIKIHRKIIENPIFKRSAYFHLWVLLLLKANHEEKKMIWNGGVIIIKEGQLITGRKALAKETDIPETSIERILDYLENEHQIGQQKTTKYRLITILNWKDYQSRTEKRTTNGQQTDTNKNVKNYKNTNTSDKSHTFNPLGSEVIKAFEEVDPKNKTYYGNKTQRASCDFLLQEYGMDKVLQAIKILPQINQKKLYIKQITTPYELKENWVKIGNALKQEKSDIKNKPNYIL